jgi:hypothetical protein
VTLTFDDIPGGSIHGTYGSMPEDYQGFGFSDNLDWVDVVASIWHYGARSGEFALLNNYHGTGIVTATGGADFTFHGLWAKAWGTAPESGGPAVLFGTLADYNDGALVWSVDTALNGSYAHYAAQAGLIDELHLSFGSLFLVDDLSLNVTAVPETSTIAMMMLGLALVGAGVRHRR